MAAMPIASEAALELAVTHLDPRLPDDIDASRRAIRSHRATTAKLWRRTERELLQAFPSVSLDEFVAIRDMLWFQQGAESAPSIGEYVCDMAKMFLESRGSVVSPRLPAGHLGRSSRPPTSAESRRTLRWLTMALPPDLLCAAAARGDDALELALTNPTLDKMLREGGFAELHLHLGAAVDFNTIWQALVANLGRASFRPDMLLSPGAELDEGRRLGPWLIRAAVVRLILAAYLRDRLGGPNRGEAGARRAITFEEYPGLRDYLDDTANWRRLAPAAGNADRVVADAAIGDLLTGRLRPDINFRWLQHLYRRVSEIPDGKVVSSLDEIELLDPLSQIFHVPRRLRTEQGDARAFRTPEQRFVGRSLEYIRDRPGDEMYSTLFWQVVRVRCLVYRHFIQRPMTPGLQWFVRFFARAKPARSRLRWTAYLDSAAELGGRDRGLKSLEVRTSPSNRLDENLDLIRQTAEWARRDDPTRPADRWDSFGRRGLRGVLEARKKAARKDRPERLEVGIVLHFTKDRGGGARAGLPSGHWSGTHSDPDPGDPRLRVNSSGLRYSRFYLGKRAEAVSLARTLQRWPRSLMVIRGLDVCTDELGVPSWVMKPLLDRVRHSAFLGGLALERLGRGPAPPLQTTVHAGEDFVHLATGLRNVDEAIDHLGLREGDRIGHGLALGVNATAWANTVGRVAIPREVRMWDLLWEWSWIGSRGGGGVPRHAFIERELSRLTELAFGEIIQPYRLELLRDDLLDGAKLWAIGFPNGDHPIGEIRNNRLRLLYKYLSNPLVFRRGRRVEWIDPTDEASALEHLQDGLRRKVGELALTVEINPTSNLLIGDLGSLTQHPMWRLDPPVSDSELPPVAIGVGSDDPLMFASSLIEEYNILYDALMEAGLTDADARDWLERVRRRGLESRFTWDPYEISPVDELPNPLRDYPTQLV
ncbi:MAG: hypothetical protein GY939_09315 [Actinomycetia bacterium]|nr:hypothetical protein [Actinomycetes bacterium]